MKISCLNSLSRLHCRSPMKLPRFTLRELFLLVALVAMGCGCNSGSTCGGNNAARSHVAEIVLTMQGFALNRDGGEFSLVSASDSERQELAKRSTNSWTGTASYLLSKESRVTCNAEERNHVVICDRPFTNVPHYMVGEAPPTHAVGYSDGSTELISTQQFAALDLTEFVALNKLP